MDDNIIIPEKLQTKINVALAELVQANNDLNWPVCQRQRTAEARAQKALAKLTKYKAELSKLGIVMHWGC